MRVLALDFGEARCGVAVSDPTGTLATPLDAVQRPDTKRGLATLGRLVTEYEPDHVLVGLPLTLAGDEGPQAQRTREFAGRLAERIGVPVVLHDERLTTRQALREGARDVDSRAAAHLLDGYLARGVAARPA